MKKYNRFYGDVEITRHQDSMGNAILTISVNGKAVKIPQFMIHDFLRRDL